MSNNGWIKVHRCLIDSNVFDNPNVLKVWIWCLCKATHKPREQIVGLQNVHLEEGQFIFGRSKASEKLKMKESTVWKTMKLLEKIGSITINSNNKFSVVTIEKWRDYQVDDADDVTTEEQQRNNKGTTEEQQSNTNKNVKNVKKDIYSEVPEPIKESFMEWVAMRKKIKKPVTTQTTVTRALNTLNKLTTDVSKQIELIQLATDRCWQSFYMPNDYGSAKPKEEPKVKRYRDFEPEPEVDAVQMPDEIREKLGRLF